MQNEAADRIYEKTAALAQSVVEAQFRHYPELAKRYGPVGRQKCAEDAAYHFWHLAEAIRFDAPELFVSYLGWAKILLNALGIRPDDLQKNAEFMREASESILPAEVHLNVARTIDAALKVFPSLPDTTPSFVNPSAPNGQLVTDYLEALLARDNRRARRLIVEALDSGLSRTALYDDVFTPCLREVGRLWQTRKINEAQEHYCAETTHQILSLISADIDVPMRKQSVVGLCVAGEKHSVGLRIALDCFALNGWDTQIVGADTPTRNIEWLVRVWRPDVLAISVTMTYHLREASLAIASLREIDPELRPLILVGGSPFAILPGLSKKIGADLEGSSCAHAIELANARQ